MSDQATPAIALLLGVMGFIFFSINMWQHEILGILFGLGMMIFAYWFSGQDYWWWPTHAEDRLKAIQEWEKESDVEKALEHFKEVK